jgi:hypothetical protein
MIISHPSQVFEGEKKYRKTQSANAECHAPFKENGEVRIQVLQKKLYL